MDVGLVRWWLLGRRPSGRGDGSYDAVDLALEFADGSVRALGLRTPESFGAGAVGWSDGHVPFATDLAPSEVGYWSFDRVLWLGPAATPCVAWTNALALTDRGIEVLLRSRGAAAMVAGSGGRGLPLLDEVVRS